MADQPAGPNDVVKTLDRARHQLSLTCAGMWGAVHATAPKDRWQHADDSLAEAARLIEEARRQLAQVDKQEAYCETCGVALLHYTAGWRHWNGEDIYHAGHEPALDWRPVEKRADED